MSVFECVCVCVCVCQRRDVCCLLSCYAGDVCEKRGYGPITQRAGSSERGREILKKPSHLPAEAAARLQSSTGVAAVCVCFVLMLQKGNSQAVMKYLLLCAVFGRRNHL